MTPEEQARAMLGAECARINYLDTSRAVREAADTSSIVVPADAALRALAKALSREPVHKLHELQTSREERVRGEERERCAGIAENIAPHFPNPMGDAIAAAIRSAPSSQRGD